MKKIIAMVAAVTTFALVGATGCKKKEGAEPEKPVYQSTETYDIGMWVGVSDKICEYDEEGHKISSRMMSDDEFLEKYRDIAAAGITIAFPGYDVMIDGGSYNLKALKAAKEVGIRHIIGDAELRTYLLGAKTLVDSEVKTEDEVVEDIRNLISKYTESEYADALYGFMVRDEPSADLFDSLGYAEKVFKKAAPDLMFYVNLFPVIAGGQQLGGGSPIKYDAYLSRWISSVKNDYISYDHYPLYGDGVKTSIEESFLYNMDVIQTKIREEGKNRKLWTFLQSIQFGGKNRALESKADAAFQAYSFLAYGGDCIQWFCYAAPPENDGATHFGNNSLVTREYEKTPTYDYVSAVNADVQAMMKYYKCFDWKGVMLSSVYDDTGNFGMLEGSENVISSAKAKGFESTEDAFAGVFEDANGREGYLVVNFTDPALKRKNTVTMTFEGATRAIVVRGGEETVEKLDGGKLVLEMSEGDGFFVIPY